MFLADNAFRYFPVFLLSFPSWSQERTWPLLSIDSGRTACRHWFPLAFVFQNSEVLEDSHKGGRERRAGCERGGAAAGLSGAGAHTHFSQVPREMAVLGGKWLSALKEAGLCLYNAQAQRPQGNW